MDHRYFSLLDMAIVGVPVLIISIWQLVSVNRAIAKDKAKAAELTDRPLPDGSGHPIGQHRLDDR